MDWERRGRKRAGNDGRATACDLALCKNSCEILIAVSLKRRPHAFLAPVCTRRSRIPFPTPGRPHDTHARVSTLGGGVGVGSPLLSAEAHNDVDVSAVVKQALVRAPLGDLLLVLLLDLGGLAAHLTGTSQGTVNLTCDAKRRVSRMRLRCDEKSKGTPRARARVCACVALIGRAHATPNHPTRARGRGPARPRLCARRLRRRGDAFLLSLTHGCSFAAPSSSSLRTARNGCCVSGPAPARRPPSQRRGAAAAGGDCVKKPVV